VEFGNRATNKNLYIFPSSENCFIDFYFDIISIGKRILEKVVSNDSRIRNSFYILFHRPRICFVFPMYKNPFDHFPTPYFRASESEKRLLFLLSKTLFERTLVVKLNTGVVIATHIRMKKLNLQVSGSRWLVSFH
jgi:hypothetical protein